VIDILIGFLLGAFATWLVRNYLAERDQDRAEERRDAAWDAEHLTKRPEVPDA
jgi:hypothetical protein